MMSQPRMRRAGSLAGDTCNRARATLAKASGDSAPCNVNSKQSYQRSRSKNRLPKNVRYDLENALVGLCDIWFEEIKPHLVRNNIKVHVEEGSTSPACGDHSQLPLGIDGCSHLHPGAASDVRATTSLDIEYSASVCELCRLLFNAANSIESAVSQASNATAIFAASTGGSTGDGSGSPAPTLAETKQPRKSKLINKHTQTPHVPQLYVSQTMSPDFGVRRGTATCKLQPRLQPRGISPEFGRCPGTTTLFPPRLTQYKSLFDEHPRDATAKKYATDKGIRVLYKRVSFEYPSSMNLVTKLKTLHKDCCTRRRPWK